MQKELSYMTKSGIRGRATAVFGGAILIQAGYDPKKMTGIISIAELENQQEVGSKLKEGTGYYNPQINLVFNDLGSIDILRDALDNLEYSFKHGELRPAMEKLPNRI